MIAKVRAFIEREQKAMAVVGNFVVPFTIGYLLHSALPVSNWRFWAIILLVLMYRGTRGKNG